MDTITPLLTDENNNKHIDDFIDWFSRYLSLYPVPDAGGINYTKALIHIWVIIHTYYTQIETSNGTKFKNELTLGLGILLKINHKAIFNSKEENRLVEMINDEVMGHMRNIYLIFVIKTKNQCSNFYLFV